MTAILAGLRLVPKWVWIALAAAIAFRLAIAWHDGKIRALETAAYDKGFTAATDAAARMQAARAKRDAELTAQMRRQHNEELARLAASADALRLRGPGKARCAAAPILPPGPGGHGTPGSAADAPGPEMPPGDWAAVPWGWIVVRAEQHDAMRAEIIAWRGWHKRLSAEWAKQD